MRLVVSMCMLALGWMMMPQANADTGPSVPTLPFGGSPGIGGEFGIGTGPGLDVVNLSPSAATIFLCPGMGAAANVVGGGGGYCDFNFQEVRLPGPPGMGVSHIHCEWGGFSPIVEMWNCWRVFPGQPDHPSKPDPDIIPDGWSVPWAINGPTPNDQWPPLGLAPAPPPGPPPSDQPGLPESPPP